LNFHTLPLYHFTTLPLYHFTTLPLYHFTTYLTSTFDFQLSTFALLASGFLAVLCYSELSSSYTYSVLSSLQYTHPPTKFNSPIPISTLSISFPFQTEPSLTIPPYTISHQTSGPADIHFSKPSSVISATTNHRRLPLPS
jgi:hypothetical protein